MITIYALSCSVTGKSYIGSTKGKIAKRMREHRCLLNSGQHKTAELQADWKRYGEVTFRIAVLETVNGGLQERRDTEVRWMEVAKLAGTLYNEHIISMRPADEAIRRGVEASRHVVGNRWSAEANEKRRVAQLGKPKGHGAKISATKRAKRQVMI